MEPSAEVLTIASNQGAIGGGEVMLLLIAEAARELGRTVHIVGPDEPSDLVQQAQARGFPVTALPGRDAATYLRNLRRWDGRHRDGVLWCNGLRPAVATVGHRCRVVHLHQQPSRKLAPLARVARLGALATVVPSASMARHVPGSTVMWNWTAPVQEYGRRRVDGEPFVVGFLGRLSPDKGLLTLCEALQELLERGDSGLRLLVGGETRFVTRADAQRVENALATLGAHVIRRHWMDREEFFRSVDVAVFPSISPESFGLVTAESMSAGCPFIISDAGALPEVAGKDYRWTFPAGDVHRLADLIRHAEHHDWSDQLATSRHRSEAEFSPDSGRQRLSALLDRVGLRTS